MALRERGRGECGGGEEDALDAAAVCGGEDAGGDGAEADAIAGSGEPAERLLDGTADRGAAAVAVEVDAVFGEVEQRGVAAADDAVVGKQADAAWEVVLVPDLADDFLEDVFDGDDAVEGAVFVDDGAEGGALLLEAGEQRIERQRRRHDHDLVPECFDGSVVVAVEERLGQFARVDDAE